MTFHRSTPTPEPTPEEAALLSRIDALRAEIREILKDPERTRQAAENIRVAVEGSTYTAKEAAAGLSLMVKLTKTPASPPAP